MRAIALTLCISLCACFPNDARARFYAKVGEGASLVGGIVLLAFVNTAADCENKVGTMPGVENDQSTCRKHADAFNELGVGMILAGLLGFVATISTTPDDKPDSTIISPGLTPASMAGSGSAAPVSLPPPAPPPPAPAPPAPVPAPPAPASAP